MSLFVSMHADCPACAHTNTFDAVGSVNADRRPDLRDAILDDSFQIVTCANCRESFRLQPEFNYLDVENGLWILALPAAGVPDYLDNEDRTAALFSTSYGAGAPAAAQEVGKQLQCRVTFGWPAVREKLITRLAGMDDRVLELTKMDLLRRLPGIPIDLGVELRLAAVTDGNLEFAWMRTGTEEALEIVRVSRAAYDNIAAAREDWAAAEAHLADGPFVDIQKLFLGQGRGASAS